MDSKVNQHHHYITELQDLLRLFVSLMEESGCPGEISQTCRDHIPFLYEVLGVRLTLAYLAWVTWCCCLLKSLPFEVTWDNI